MDDCGPLFHGQRRPGDLEYHVSRSFRNCTTSDSPYYIEGEKLEKPHREKVNLCNTRNCTSLHTVLSLSYQGQWLPLPGFRVRAYGKRLKSPLSIKRQKKREMSAREFTFCGFPNEPKRSRFVLPSRYPLTRKTIRSARAPNRRIEYDFQVFSSLITFHPSQKGLLCFWSNVDPGLGPTLAEEIFSSFPEGPDFAKLARVSASGRSVFHKDHCGKKSWHALAS